MTICVRVHEWGGPEQLRLDEVDLGAPGSGQIKVKMLAIGLNRAECALRAGEYLQRPALPACLGFEGAGTITAVGPECGDFAVGDYVSFIPGHVHSDIGTYAEEAIMPAALAVRTPEMIEPVTAASMWMQYLTVYGGMIEAGGLKAGETALVTAASSSVGLAAIEVCRKLGVTSIATTRGAGKVDRLRAAGADHVIVTDQTPIDEGVMAITDGAGADLIFDPVAGNGVEALGRAAAFNGRIIIYGGMDGKFAPYPYIQGMMKGLSMRAFYLLELTGKPDWLARGKKFVLEGVERGDLKPVIDRTFALRDVQEAHRYLETGAQFGKVVLLT